MRRFRKIAGVMMVWATAATTLLAGTPHFDCRCPDGSIKRYCFSSASGESSCCCSGTCSKANDDKSCCRKQKTSSQSTAKHACCCKQSKSQGGSVATGSNPVNGPAVRGTCCQKSLANLEFQSSVRVTAVVDDASVAHVFVLPAMDIEYFSNAAPSRTVWQVHWLPPPTDLVTTLHRLVI
jgi:hypothetical protein